MRTDDLHRTSLGGAPGAVKACTFLDSHVITMYSGRRGRTEIVPESGPQPGSGADDLLALLETITRPTLIIPEAGHSAYWGQPDIFNHAVLAFLQRVDRQARSET